MGKYERGRKNEVFVVSFFERVELAQSYVV